MILNGLGGIIALLLTIGGGALSGLRIMGSHQFDALAGIAGVFVAIWSLWTQRDARKLWKSFLIKYRPGEWGGRHKESEEAAKVTAHLAIILLVISYLLATISFGGRTDFLIFRLPWRF